uniref:Uncharacterized protein n=1 Tax=Monopterus albus TaxID=43700 RepID=A0A3Q3J7M8_MONAL
MLLFLCACHVCFLDCKFNIQIYKEDSRISKAVGKGRPVMLYADKDGKKMVACCSDRQEIYPEAMDLPNKINETAHKALFYLTGISGSTAMYTFESSLYTGKFLGFKPVEDNPSLDKLVLLESKPDEVDEAICFRW